MVRVAGGQPGFTAHEEPTMSRSIRLPGALLGLAILSAACGGAGATTPASIATASQTATGTAATTPGSSPASPSPSASASAQATTAGSPASQGKVSANTATQAELIAAFTAAGVPNPDKWTKEVMEYRPYDTSDPTLQALQDNLAKYNPSASTLAGILSVLEP
jgi:hypothetical protein